MRTIRSKFWWMPKFWWMIGAAMLASAPAHAQVINGESTYEDNFAHTPPSIAAEAKARDPNARTDPDPGKASSRDLRERDRD